MYFWSLAWFMQELANWASYMFLHGTILPIYAPWCCWWASLSWRSREQYQAGSTIVDCSWVRGQAKCMTACHPWGLMWRPACQVAYWRLDVCKRDSMDILKLAVLNHYKREEYMFIWGWELYWTKWYQLCGLTLSIGERQKVSFTVVTFDGSLNTTSSCFLSMFEI